ncbi:hypothetical protein MmiHf6_10630 [Methanimicrococcus hongohii]|uniref:Uncharacterized protein n=1 Tax=Methanimicrococcus hongohii TaxID=3028295 RepID=A0AA96V296_9EURY|nr:InlB B-repeat-containing protein [Methanimicrococcus sp. Hf6]WNY23748.1 hypothetical protein MmiHf6_10630 [Methanimicrococcus sp. Hf6]
MEMKNHSIAAIFIALCIVLLMFGGVAAADDNTKFVILDPNNGEPLYYLGLDADGKCDELTFNPSIPTGYRSFLGWYKDGESTPFNFETGTIASGTVLKAKYSQNYIVHFMDEYNIVIDSYTLAPEGQLYSSSILPTSSDADYSFNHWYLKGTSVETAFPFPTTVGDSYADENGTITFLPAFSNNCTVIFISDGTQVDPQTIPNGGKLTRPTSPTRTGYTFVKWVDSNGKDFSFDTPVTESLVLTAVWEGKTVNYTVLYWLEDPNTPGKYNALKMETKTAKAGSLVTDLSPGTLGGTIAHADYNVYNSSSPIILGGGGTVVNLFYDLIEYTIIFDLDPDFSTDVAVGGTITTTMTVNGQTYTQTYSDSTKATEGEQYSFKAKMGQEINGLWPCSSTAEFSRDGIVYSKFASWSREAASVNYVSNRPYLSPEMVNAGSTVVTYPANWGTTADPHEVQYYFEKLLHEIADGQYGSKDYVKSPLYSENYKTNTNSLQAKEISGMTALNPNAQTTNPKMFYYDRFTRDIVYVLDGGSFESGSLPAVSGYTQTGNSYTNVKWGEQLSHFEPTATPVKTVDGIDYVFQKWTYDAEGLIDVNFDEDFVPEPTTATGETLPIYAQWRSGEFTITFYENTGSNEVVATQTGARGGTIDFSDDDLYPPGHVDLEKGVFKGWYWLVSGKLVSYAPDTVISGHTNLYAQWQSSGFTVTYSGNGNNAGTVPTDDNRYDIGVFVTMKPGNGLAQSDLLVFTGWKVENDDTLYRPGDPLQIAGNMKPGAEYANRNDLVKLTYHSNKTNIEDVSFYVERTTINLAQSDLFTADNEYVEYWVDKDGTKYPCGSTYTVSGSGNELDLYAVWKSSGFNVTFYAGQNGYLNREGTQRVEFTGIPANTAWTDAGITVPTPKPSDSLNHYFSHWINKGGETVADPNTYTHQIVENEEYTAIFAEVIEVTVTFHGYPATFKPSGLDEYSTIAEIGQLITDVPEFDDLPIGYAFGGWYTSMQTYGGPLDASDEWDLDSKIVEGASSIDLYAGWIKMDDVSVTYNANGASGGSVPAEPTFYKYNEIATVLDQGTLWKADYKFSGWSTTSTGSVEYEANDEIVMTSDIELFAVWSAITDADKFSLTYNANGGSGDAPVDSNRYSPNEPATVSGQGELYLVDFKFDGWSTTSTGSVEYEANDEIVMTSDIELFAVWSAITDADKFSLTYNANGGSGDAPVDSNRYSPNEPATVSGQGELYLVDFKFDGWSTTSTGSVEYEANDEIVMTSDIELFAVWSAITDADKFSLTYNANGGSGDAPVDSNRYSPNEPATVSGQGELYLVDFKFDGWSTTSTGSVEYEANDEIVMTSDIELFAVWSAITDADKFSLTYNANGGSGDAPVDSNRYSPNEPATVSGQGELYLVDFKFDGWSTTSTGSVEYEANDEIVMTSDIELFAVWSAITDADKFSLTYNANGGSGDAPVDSNRYSPNEPATVSGQGELYLVDFKFDGWSTTSTGSVEYEANDEIVMTSDIELFAVWSAITDADKFSLTYNANGGSGDAPVDSNRYSPNEPATVSGQGELYLVDFKFDGWSTTSTGSVEYEANDEIVMTSDIELFAVWSAITDADKFSLTYNANGGSGDAPVDSNRYSPNEPATVSGQGELYLVDFKFDGWSTTSTGSVEYEANDEIVMTSDIELFAVWSAITDADKFSLTYNANGGSGDAPVDSNRYSPNEPATVSGQGELYLVDFKFDGWSTTSTGSVEYEANDEIVMTSDIELFAVWSAITDADKFSLTYNANGGSGDAPVDSNRYSPNEPATVSGQGELYLVDFKFDGWSTTSTGSVEYEANDEIVMTSDIELFAVWSAITDADKFSLTYNANGGSGDAPVDSNRYSPNEPATVSGQGELYLVDFKFDGWSTTSTGSVEYEANDEIVMTSDIELFAVWSAITDADKFSLTYNANGGSGDAPVDSNRYSPNEPATVSGQGELYLVDFKFDGWSTTSTGSVEYEANDEIVMTSDIELFAVWSAITDADKFSLTYNANGGSGDAPVDSNRYSPNEPATVSGQGELYLVDFKFDGWSTTSTGSVEYEANDEIVMTSDIELFAVWSAITDADKFSLTYNANGGSGDAPVDSNRYSPNEPATVSGQGELYLVDFKFDGWSTTSTGSVEYEANDEIVMTSDIELFAVWSAITDADKFSLTYNANGGSGDAPVDSNRYSPNEPATVSGQGELYLVDFKFDGWSTTSTGSVEYEANDEIVMTSDIELFAVWSAITDADKFSLTYNANGGSGDAPVDSNRYSPNEPATVSGQGELYLVDFKFDGWSTTSTGSVEYEANDEIVMTSDIELFAVWSAITDADKFSLTYNANGGSGDAPVDSNRYSPNEPATVSGQGELYLVDFKFDGWSTTSTGSVEYEANDEIVMTSDIELFAVWSAITDADKFSLTYNANGGSGDAPVDSNRYSPNEPATVSGQGELYLVDFKFDGWSTTSTGSVEYEANDEIVMTSDIELFAVWSAITDADKFSLTYNANGGSGDAPVDSNRYSPNEPATVSGQGELYLVDFKFDGWSTTSTGSVEYEANDEIVMTSDIELFAVWSAITDADKFSLTYNANGGSGDAPVDSNRYSPNEPATVSGQGELYLVDFKFDGWSTTSTGSVEYEANDEIVMTSDIELFAVWSAITDADKFSLTYNANGGSGDAPVDSNRYSPNEPATVSGQGELYLVDFKFDGWSTTSTGSVEYEANDEIVMTSDIELFAVWSAITDADKFSLTYNANGGSGDAPVDSNRYSPNENATVLGQGDLYKVGSKFTGWSTASDGIVEYVADDQLKMVSNVELFAVWTPLGDDEYLTITYHGNPFAVDDDVENIPVPVTGISPNEPITLDDGSGMIYTGYVFHGWNNESEGTGTSYSGIVSINENLELYAQWKAYDGSDIVVTFDADGGVPEPADQPVTYNGKATEPTQPAKEDHRFIHWYDVTDGTDDNIDTAWSFETRIISDLSLKAKWEATTGYNITYYQNINNEDPTSYIDGEYTSGQQVQLLNATELGFSNPGYVLLGWSTSATGSLEYYQGVPIVMPYQDLNFYAVWGDALVYDYYINYYPNGADNAVEDKPVKIYYEDSTSVKIAGYADTGFKKSGEALSFWSERDSLTATTYKVGQTYDMSDKGAFTELDALWDGVLEVTFHAAGGNFTGDELPVARDKYTVSLLYGQTIPQPADLFAEEGVTLNPPAGHEDEIPVYWVTSDGIRWFFADYSLENDVDLYAVWPSADLATVVFNARDGEFHIFGVAESQKTYSYITTTGSLVSEPGSSENVTVVSPVGYEIAGWYNGSTKWDFVSNTVETELLELSAIWVKRSGGGGTGTAVVTMSLAVDEPVEEEPEELPAFAEDLEPVSPGGAISDQSIFSKISELLTGWVPVMVLLMLILFVGFGLYRFKRNGI